MTKNEFLRILKEQLRGLSDSDIKEIIFDYEEHFQIGMTEGRSEEEIAISLGNPKTLAKEIRANYLINKVENEFSVGNFFHALFATLGLGLLNIIFILGPFIGIAGALLGIFIAGIAIIGGGLLTIIASFLPNIFQNVPNPVMGCFIGLLLISVGSLWTIFSWNLNKYFYLLAIRYLKFNVNIITKRRMKND